MTKQHHAVVMASLAADALALGAHWIYDTQQIDHQCGRMDQLRAPLPTSFHAGKSQGELTHYGDQTVVLLQSLMAKGGFSLGTFALAWRRLFQDYHGYRDHATKATLEQFEKGASLEEIGSSSSDLGGAARIAPLVYRYQNDEETMVTTARQQTAMTHRDQDVVDSAVFFSCVTATVMQGIAPMQALQDVVHSRFNRSPFNRWVNQGIDSRQQPTRETIAQFGQACDVSSGFPGTIHLIAKYQENPQEGLIENVMAGGDSAARGMIAGMVFGAHAGMEAVRTEWVAGIQSGRSIQACLDTLIPVGSEGNRSAG